MKVEVIEKKFNDIDAKVYVILGRDMSINNYYATSYIAKEMAQFLNIDYNEYLKIMKENYKVFIFREYFGIEDDIKGIAFFNYDDAKKAVDWINSISLMNALNDTR